MSKESALKFAQLVMEDNELRERTAKLEPDKLLPIAKEMGYDFTVEEMTEVMDEDRELTPEDLESASGGTPVTVIDSDREKIKHCYFDLSAPLHDWVVDGHTERWLFWKWSYGVDFIKCSRCGAHGERHV